MRLGFLVSDVDCEEPDYTTTKLALTAAEAGHEVFYLDLDSISSSDSALMARACPAPDNTDVAYDTFLADLRKGDRIPLDVGDLDVLMLRHEPEFDAAERPWSQSLGVSFGEMAVRRGVVVLNDPIGFDRAASKMYLQDFPDHIRPRTLVTRDESEAKDFIEELGNRAVIKPLQSGKGENVFLVRPDEDANLNQMIEAIRKDGYLVVQEYLEDAADGDMRLLMMNGEPLRIDETYAAVFRKAPEDDLRSNISMGGEAQPAEVGEEILSIARTIKPRLVEDGMFFVGVDVAGDKMIEINATSPGTLTSSHWTTCVDFAPIVVEELERKVELRRKDPDRSNRELATA